MADTKAPAASEPHASSTPKPEIPVDAKAAKPLKPPNPMWKYLGFGENFRPKLPSRNWTIFLTITSSFTAAVIYDKREKKRAQRKWCKLVEHIAKEPLDARSMPRKLTVFLEGPPTDGLRVAQDHFKDYVKPILVASGLDWEFIQGRKEGDVRAELAERIRNSRTPPEQRTEEDIVTETRRKSGIKEFDGPRGDIVLGRHTWKEYVRGLHEGWLGPLTEPSKPVEEKSSEDTKEKETMETLPGITLLSEPREADATPPVEDTTPKPDDKAKKPPQPAPFISVSGYATATTPPDLPMELDPSTPISFPHILGFLNTPKRLYRFLNRRVLADAIGRETAAIILSTYRPYHSTSDPSAELPGSFSSEEADGDAQNGNNGASVVPQTAEQQRALIEEEKEWHKSARVRVDDEPERTWLEPVVLDPRIASRMRRSELTPEDEARARKIVVPEEEIEGWIKGGIRSLGREGVKLLGFGKEKLKPVGTDGEDILE
ncbi:mitochondrial import inner membrane translocase subunit Tim54 [Cadophora sp. MPI-SDFR-AT-0126]|nr:mitochondrial import inner membrane translocase subunit Tim54 [Leotiomycetes sp. MPI-SDFR-AT-0126]